METILDKKQIWVIFLFEFKMGLKLETTCSTNSIFAQELLRNRQCSGGSSSFARKMRTWKMRSAAAGRQSLTTANWEQSSKMSHLKPHEKRSCRGTQHQPLYGHSTFKALWEVKQRDKWEYQELTTNQKNFWSVIFSYSMQQQWTISQ